MGPIIIFDKSALQALSVDECVWLENFFFTNVTPLFYVETLADLEKEGSRGRSPEQIVGELAVKVPQSGTAAPNMHHHRLVLEELRGSPFEMGNRPIVSEGVPKKDAEGKVGLHMDESAENQALHRWYEKKFQAIERDAAKQWREELAQLDFETTMNLVKNVIPSGKKFKSLEEIKAFCDDFVKQKDPNVLRFLFQLLEVPEGGHKKILDRYEKAGKPSIDSFAPYASFVFKVDLFFYIALLCGQIGKDRPSNKVDMAYLYYLPFCHCFVSSDKLHARTAPLFMEHGQEFVWGEDLKQALKEWDEFYTKNHSEEIEEVGVMQFTSYPPLEIENVASKLWDQFCPNWKDSAKKKLAGEVDAEAGKRTAKEMQESMEKAKAVEESALKGKEPDYVIVKRPVSVRKGKWRKLPKSLEKDAK